MQRRWTPQSGKNGSGRGFVAALAGLGLTEAVAAMMRSRSFIDAAGQVIVDRGPVPVVERTVQLVGTADKPAIRAAVAATVLTAGGLLGRLPRRPARDLVTVSAAAIVGAILCRRRAADSRAGTDQRVGSSLAAGSGALGTLGVLAAPPAAPVSYTHLTLPTICSV